MLTTGHAFSGFSVRDADEAKEFYEGVLGLACTMNEMGILDIELPHGGHVIAYPKGDGHVPATFTVLNFEVEDIDAAVGELAENGVVLERYEGLTDDAGVARGKSQNRGPDIAWFLDPSGNILSVLSN
ncbi:VOC family protein [Frondihabitans australicus]|uniref:Putative enzyme related to lactoylglutathione lyase n=1 Tax=Frondihabitans australicus TaxID=386892 RepID=A0A495IEA6_9MICO|nr:VOC family protein [Frondihabitans australicus]RKR74333.1 putative enzyme related to lactoylglutathione lyase [Frondihabitans australicus]